MKGMWEALLLSEAAARQGDPSSEQLYFLPLARMCLVAHVLAFRAQPCLKQRSLLDKGTQGTEEHA